MISGMLYKWDCALTLGSKKKRLICRPDKVLQKHVGGVLSVAVSDKNDLREDICLSLAERVGFEPT